MDLLTLAFYLSVLSYCIGLLLRALPLPFIAVKRLGRALVIEGVFSCILTFSYKILVYLVDYFSSLLGASWPAYSAWLAEKISALLMLITGLKAVGILLSKVGLGFIAQSLVSQVVSLVTTSLTTLIATSIISTILYSNAAFLIALGIVLHAIPFKLARGVGATVIAAVLVFTIGIPLMPSFIATFSSATAYTLAPENICTGTLRLIDAVNTPLGQAVIEGYVEDRLAYRYAFGSDGLLALDKTQGLPCTRHNAIVSVVDAKYTVTLESPQGDKYDLLIKLPNLLAVITNRFVLLDSSVSITSVSKEGNVMSLVVNSPRDFTIKTYFVENDVFTVYIDGVAPLPDKTETLGWCGVNYVVQVYSLAPGIHYIEINLEQYTPVAINVDVYPYIVSALGLDILAPENALLYSTQLFVELTVLPLVYVALLTTITINLARLLGGASTYITKIVAGY